MSTSAPPQLRPAGSVYGPIVTGATVERAVLALLRERATEYIGEACRQLAREPLPEPRGYIVASAFDKWPEDQLPVVVVISPGWNGRPRRDGRGAALVPWGLTVAVVASAMSLAKTRENALVYVGALRTLIAQHQSLDGLAAGVDCIDESYRLIPFVRTRSLFAAQAVFTVTVPDAFTYGLGVPPWMRPPVPDPVEPPEWPRAKSVDIELVLTDPATPFEEE
jgi:hypothetical protein